MAINSYHIGCTAWDRAEWVGSLFREGDEADTYLSQYARVFNTVEATTTHYDIPSPEAIAQWDAQTPDGFKFCFKFHRSITHHQLLDDTQAEVNDFMERFEPIYSKLGPFLIQLPTSFSPDLIDRLEKTLAALPGSFRYVVEVLNEDFFDQGRNERRLDQLLSSYNVDRLTFDTRRLHALRSNDPSIREAQRKNPELPVLFSTTGSRPVVRFLGANDPDNNETHLKEWAIMVADWIKEGLHPYVFAHAPKKMYQPFIARSFHQKLGALIDIDPMPGWPGEDRDEQLDLF